MIKIFHVAVREFAATVLTKAFLLGILLPPAIMGVMLTLMPILMNKASPKVEGHMAIIDQTGIVASRIEQSFTPEEIAKRRAEKMKKAADVAPVPDALKKQMEQSASQAAAMVPQAKLTVRSLPQDASVDAEKAPILAASGKDKNADGADPRLLLAVIPKTAVSPGPDGTFSGFDIFTAPRLDPEVQDDVERQIAKAIVDTRIESRGLKVDDVRSLTSAPRATAKAVTAEGDKKSSEAAKILIPGAFMFLLWISVFTCGNYLLTSTIEEKSTRVMEVLLSAVSPLQLMTGKILGQMCVGLMILVFYAGAGVMGLVLVSMMHIIDPMNLVYLGIYFIIAFALIASLMAAVGAAVSDIKEAQSLLGPIMLVLVIPMMLWFPILRNPNSMFAQVCSFIPPISPFIMVLRLAGSEPVPLWQIIASIIAGFFFVVVFLWAAAKVFRIGVLMYGKPPNFRTLIKWVRMA
jgi:ABC-2 type transport system permease protein